MNNLKKTVEKFLDTFHIDLNTQIVLVAFSGGFDSMCLLHVLSTINKSNIVAIHLNHNWRGEESAEDEICCKKFCDNLGIMFYSEMLSDDVKKTETDARNARYEFFIRCAEKFGSKCVLTAHNANDNAETVLYRIIKGTGIYGLSGIKQKRDIFYRPLLNVYRDDIEQYCKEFSLIPNNDSSNLNIEYSRNFIRHELFPQMEKINPDVIKSVNSLSYIAEKYNDIFAERFKLQQNSTKELINLTDVECFYIIKNILSKYNIDYDREKIEDIKNFIVSASLSKSGKKYSLTSGLFLYANSEYYEVYEEKDYNFEETRISSTGVFYFGNYLLKVEDCSQVPVKFPSDSEKKVYICADKLDFELRTRREGDYMYPLGANGKQKLKKYLNEKKVPQHKKNSIPLLCRGSEVFWVVGLGISEKFRVKDKVTHILSVTEREF